MTPPSTPARKAAEAICIAVRRYDNEFELKKAIEQIILAHCGDGEDKARLDYYCPCCGLNTSLPYKPVTPYECHKCGTIMLRSAIDAERRKEGVNAVLLDRIQKTFDRVENDYPDKSTEYLFEVTCSRMEEQFGEKVDAGHIAFALFQQGKDQPK